MTDITTYPMIDDFDTTLSQAWDGATGTVYLSEAVGITIPAGTTTYIVVNPGKSTMQVAKINAVDNSAKTATVSSISVDKGAGVAYTQQTHPVGSVVRISSNYAFWKDIVDGVNSKVDTNSNDVLIYKYADAAARDAGLPSPTNGTQVYLTSEGKWTDYIAGSRQDRDQGTVTANASTTVAGKGEQSTPVQLANGDETGETGAKLFATPKDLSAQIQSGTWVYGADAGGDDTYVVALTPTLSAYTTGQSLYAKVTTANTGACSFDFGPGAKNVKTLDGNDPQTGAIRAGMIVHLIYDGTNLILQNEDIASATNKGISEMCTDAEATTGTDETRYINSLQLKNRLFFPTASASASLKFSANTERLFNYYSAYTLVKQIKINIPGTIRVGFELRGRDYGGYSPTTGKVHINGVAVGTERTAATVNVWTSEFTEDFAIAQGDLVQLYCYTSNSGGGNGGARNFRIYYTVTQELDGIVNTD